MSAASDATQVHLHLIGTRSFGIQRSETGLRAYIYTSIIHKRRREFPNRYVERCTYTAHIRSRQISVLKKIKKYNKVGRYTVELTPIHVSCMTRLGEK